MAFTFRNLTTGETFTTDASRGVISVGDFVNRNNPATQGPLAPEVTAPGFLDPGQQLLAPQPLPSFAPSVQSQPVAVTDTPQGRENAINFAYANFPWLRELGISESQLRQWVTDGLQGDAIVAKVRETPQHKARFPGIRRPDGTLRATEAQYLQRNDQFAQVARQYGRGSSFNSPDDFTAFWDAELDPNEFRDRLEVYDQVVHAGRDVQDAFFVYAGIRVTPDQLYVAATNPNEAAELNRQYEVGLSSNAPGNYAEYIQRVRTVGLERAGDSILRLNDTGIAASLGSTSSLNSGQLDELADVLSRGQGGQSLQLPQLVRAFEFAVIGSAATQAGFQLPSVARIEALRQAGITRAQALQGYSQFAADQNLIRGMLSRASLASQFSVEDFEQAVFLQSGPEAELLRRAQSFEESLGRASGAAATSLSARGGVQQLGLRAFNR